MSILNEFTPVFAYGDAVKGEAWAELMSSKERNWAEIYLKFKPQLSQYIAFLRLNSLDHEDAETELKCLKTNFAWEEEFHLLWDIEAWFRSIQVKYQSLEEMLEAEEEETEPEESAFDAWQSDGGDLDLSWGRPTSPQVSISSLILV